MYFKAYSLTKDFGGQLWAKPYALTLNPRSPNDRILAEERRLIRGIRLGKKSSGTASLLPSVFTLKPLHSPHE